MANPIHTVVPLDSLLGPLAAIGDMSSSRIWAIVLGALLAVVAIALLVASWTKWGQTKSLTKCIALAFLAHVWLLMYAYGTRIVVPGFGGGNQGGVRSEPFSAALPMYFSEDVPTPSDSSESSDGTHSESESADQVPPLAPWEAPLGHKNEQPDAPELSESSNSIMPIPQLPPAVASAPPMPEAMAPLDAPEVPPLESIEQLSKLIETPSPAPPEIAMALPASSVATQAPRSTGENWTASSPVVRPGAPVTRKMDSQPLPSTYEMRLSPNRLQFAMQNGGDTNSEAAVERALAWLALNQSADGSWNAAEHGAGREPITAAMPPDSEYRHNTGLKANTAMTGLALLAFLGAGHTHLEGKYQDNVTRGLRYLLSQQFPSGDLSGRDQVGRDPTVRFARMYSHGMASLALTEAYGMTGDAVLLPPIQSACRYTMNAMNPRTGGWRYEFPTDDPGDMSQFGWQAMLLHSAVKTQSIALPQQNRVMMHRFLDSVSTGRSGGLAVYRPRPGQAAIAEQATPAMTAEAMASRLLLGFPVSSQAADEGQRFMLKHLPGQGEENLYYWYYATLALYQLRGDVDPSRPSQGDNLNEIAWAKWNAALKQQLCATQVPRGKDEGSWEPTCLWGGYGGRVYSTAVSCMCLEVYYRYLPLYKAEQFASQWQPATQR